MRRLATLGILGLLWAGCADPAPSSVEPTVITDPRDFSDVTTPGEHLHDYWGGRDVVDVLHDQVDGCCATYSGEIGLMWSTRPPEGSVVPQGAGRIEATLSWTLDNSTSLPGRPSQRFTDVELWVKTAADATSHKVGTVENGVPFTFEVTLDQDDLPHYTISLWVFDVYVVNEGGDSTHLQGSFDLMVKAFRTLPLKAFPAHPDRWLGATELWLKDLDGGTAIAVAPGPVPVGNSLCIGGTCADYVFSPEAGMIVPYDTSSVEVTVRTEPGSVPVPLLMQAHGADTRRMTNMTKESDSGGTAVFRLEVGPSVGDSPYATQSIWEFRIHVQGPNDVGVWSGSFNLTAKAIR